MTGSQDDKGVDLPPMVDFHVQFAIADKQVPFGLKAMNLESAVSMATLLASSMLTRGTLVGGFTIIREGKIEAYVPVMSLIAEAQPVFNQAAKDMVIPVAAIKGANADTDFNKMMSEAKKLKG